MKDPFNLQRFILPQDGIYETALGELRAGSKQGHWMWFIFPQLRGLGLSPTARLYGIVSLGEARAYLAHPLLGLRLRECVEAILPLAERLSAEQILGSIDVLKCGRALRSSTRSSATPFSMPALHFSSMANAMSGRSHC